MKNVSKLGTSKGFIHLIILMIVAVVILMILRVDISQIGEHLVTGIKLLWKFVVYVATFIVDTLEQLFGSFGPAPAAE
jgi:hypothetical protein